MFSHARCNDGIVEEFSEVRTHSTFLKRPLFIFVPMIIAEMYMIKATPRASTYMHTIVARQLATTVPMYQVYIHDLW